MYYLLYCLVYLTVQCGALYYLHSTPTIYLFIQLSKRHVCTQLSSFCLFPCFFLILVLSKLFFPIPIVCIVCLVHTNSSHTQFFVCLQSSIVAKQCLLLVVIFTISFNFFVSIFLCSNSLSFHSAVYSNSILLLHTYDMQIML